MSLKAQTWNGNNSSNWNDPGNWTPNNVPLPTGNVTIPSNATNWPILPNAAIVINNFTMTSGSEITFNGGTLTVNGTMTFGAQNNTAVTNIKATSNNSIAITKTGSSLSYLNNCIFLAPAIFDLTSTHSFYESYNGTTQFSATVGYSINTTGSFYSCNNYPTIYGGNLVINRNAIGNTYIFNSGLSSVSGNFTYNNIVGGYTYINNNALPNNAPAGIINGTVNINYVGNGDFNMKRVHNATTGGTINVEHARSIELIGDTIIGNINITNYAGIALDYFQYLKITGNLHVSDSVNNSGTTYFGANTIIGTTSITTKSSSGFYTSYPNADNFVGNISVLLSGTGLF